MWIDVYILVTGHVYTEPDKYRMTSCQGIFGLINELLTITVSYF